MGIGHADHQRSQPPEFLLQQTGRTIAAQRTKAVAANQLGKVAAVVRRRTANRTHLHQPHRDASTGDLPGRFSARKASSKNSDLGRRTGQTAEVVLPSP